jgi:hypothetical protein
MKDGQRAPAESATVSLPAAVLIFSVFFVHFYVSTMD